MGASSVIFRQMNMKNKASAILVLLTAAWVFSSGAICRASDAVAPFCFTNELAAFTNGQAVVAALKRGDEPGRKQLRALIGSRVLFDGSAGSGNADLKIGKDILLEVEVSHTTGKLLLRSKPKSKCKGYVACSLTISVSGESQPPIRSKLEVT